MKPIAFSKESLEANRTYQKYQLLCSAVAISAAKYLSEHNGLTRKLGQRYAKLCLTSIIDVATVSVGAHLATHVEHTKTLHRILHPDRPIKRRASSVINSTKHSLPYLIDALILHRPKAAFTRTSFATIFMRQANIMLNMGVQLEFDSGGLTPNCVLKFKQCLQKIVRRIDKRANRLQRLTTSIPFFYFIQLRNSIANTIEFYTLGINANDGIHHGRKGKEIAREMQIKLWQIETPRNEDQLKISLQKLLTLLEHYLLERNVSRIEGRIPRGRDSLTTQLMLRITADAMKLTNLQGEGALALHRLKFQYRAQSRGWHLRRTHELLPEVPQTFMQLLRNSADNLFQAHASDSEEDIDVDSEEAAGKREQLDL